MKSKQKFDMTFRQFLTLVQSNIHFYVIDKVTGYEYYFFNYFVDESHAGIPEYLFDYKVVFICISELHPSVTLSK